MSWSLLVACASAGPSVEAGWALYRVGAYDDASELAAAALHEEPGRIAWQRLYARSRGRIDGDAAVIAQYRRWAAEAPTDPGRRVLLADVLATAWRFEPEWCGEIENLLAVGPAESDARFWTHAVRYEVRTTRCPADPSSDREALLAQASTIEGGAALALPLALEDGIDGAEAEWIQHALDEEPAMLGRLEGVFAQSGRGTKRARKAVLAAADRAMEGDLAQVFGAARIYEAAGSSRLAEAESRLAALHPDRHRYGFAREIARARQHADPSRALAQLEALAADLPEEAELRARYHGNLGDLRVRTGDLPRAVDAYARAWTATPTHPERANHFAYYAVLVGVQLEQALEAADAAVKGFESQRFAERSWPGETLAEWRARTATQVGEARDTRAWVLHRLGRSADAVPDALQAVRLVDDPVVELHAGLVLTAVGDADAAAPHLARGVLGVGEGHAESEARDRAAALLRDWWSGAGIWHPGGLEGWMEDLDATLEPVPPTDPSILVGSPLPDAPLLMGEIETRLSAVEGPAVVDVWATWCRPCVDALPAVEALAGEYPDVTFLALSVDDEHATVDRFFEGADPQGVSVAWWSGDTSPYEALGIAGVPSLFVIDRDRRVSAYLFGADLDRLGSAVEAVTRPAE